MRSPLVIRIGDERQTNVAALRCFRNGQETQKKPFIAVVVRSSIDHPHLGKGCGSIRCHYEDRQVSIQARD